MHRRGDQLLQSDSIGRGGKRCGIWGPERCWHGWECQTPPSPHTTTISHLGKLRQAGPESTQGQALKQMAPKHPLPTSLCSGCHLEALTERGIGRAVPVYQIVIVPFLVPGRCQASLHGTGSTGKQRSHSSRKWRHHLITSLSLLNRVQCVGTDPPTGGW